MFVKDLIHYDNFKISVRIGDKTSSIKRIVLGDGDLTTKFDKKQNKLTLCFDYLVGWHMFKITENTMLRCKIFRSDEKRIKCYSRATGIPIKYTFLEV